ncbi:MAG: glycine--tRNA ligase subunit beta [Proteobacteria bacterium]|nr:glycine--tRNA ligase subunit beta [Pseudomonadota bacterium]
MSATETLLIEIGTEELPPKHLEKLAKDFAHFISQAFTTIGIPYGKVEHFVTPRRIAARLFDVPAEQEKRAVQKRGPAIASAYDAKGNPTAAAIGFAKGCHVDISALKVHETPQGSWLIYEYEEPGKKLIDVLGQIIEQSLHQLPIPKRMRWGASETEFVRPIHWVLVMHGPNALPINLFNLTAGNVTFGHRFHFPQAVILSHADEYVNTLKRVKVIACHSERQEIIQRAAQMIGTKFNGTTIIEDELLDQVTGLVEWPVPLHARFDKTFLEVPQEALISSMQNHQKCFAISDSNGKLLPIFILVSNTEAATEDNIIQGNERVMHARLSDAKFFYDQDRKMPLNSRLEGLKNMVFQKKLGTLYDKSQRIAKLANSIAKQINAPSHLSDRAGKLCKADLLTEMVFEFPELQGIMGNYYALHDGEPVEVATAIRESYYPRFAKDTLPQTPVGITLALADRLDTLIGIFGIGQTPTGDKDPFGLRRAALAILRILIEKELPLDLEELFQLARHGYGNLIDEEVIPQLMTFCFERFKAWYQEQGIPIQTIESVMATHPQQPYDAASRVLAVGHFQTLKEAQNLAAANKRVRNILQKNSLSFNFQHLPMVDPALFKETAEKQLYEAIESLKTNTTALTKQGKYQEALVLLASLQQVVDKFFDDVMVMTDDEKLKQNRIYLLSHLFALFMQIADISKLVI